MTTKKNFVKMMLMSTLTAATDSFTACSDDLNDFNSSAMPSTCNTNLLDLEQYSYDVPVKVNVNGDWRIDFKYANESNHFCYAYPNHGHGPAIVKLCMLDNWTNERNSGEMIITNLNNPADSKTIILSQKCNRDNRCMTRGGEEDGSAVHVNTMEGYRNTSVGYGYNIAKPMNEDAISLSPIIKLSALDSEGINVIPGKLTGSYSINTYTGSSVAEVTDKLAGSMKLTGGYGAFKGEVGASFSTEQKNVTNSYFALTNADVVVRSYTLQGINEDTAREYLTDNFKMALNNPDYDMKKLLDEYGTHLMLKVRLGGRLSYATTVNKSSVHSEEEFKTWAKASVKEKVDASISSEKKSTIDINTNDVTTHCMVYGGTNDANNLVRTDDSPANVAAWISSMDSPANMAIVDVNGETGDVIMIPVWNLVEPGNSERGNKIRQYVESGTYSLDSDKSSDQDAYNVVKFSIPSFSTDAEKTLPEVTLVKDVYYDGLPVARICNEYIPALDVTQRVTVVYPVISGKANYSTGFFVGNANKEPRMVKWNNNGTASFSMIGGLGKGQLSTLYIRNGMFYTDKNDGAFLNSASTSKVSGEVKDKFMKGKSWNGTTEIDHNYPLVKLANKVWTREDISGKNPTANCATRKLIHAGEEEGRVTYITYYTDCQAATDSNFYPGWIAASSQDFEAVKNLLSANNNQTPENALFAVTGSGDCLTGFNAIDHGKCHFGCWEKRLNIGSGHKDYNHINGVGNFWMCRDKKYCWIQEDKSFQIGLSPQKMQEKFKYSMDDSIFYHVTSEWYSMPVRLVEK